MQPPERHSPRLPASSTPPHRFPDNPTPTFTWQRPPHSDILYFSTYTALPHLHPSLPPSSSSPRPGFVPVPRAPSRVSCFQVPSLLPGHPITYARSTTLPNSPPRARMTLAILGHLLAIVAFVLVKTNTHPRNVSTLTTCDPLSSRLTPPSHPTMPVGKDPAVSPEKTGSGHLSTKRQENRATQEPIDIDAPIDVDVDPVKIDVDALPNDLRHVEASTPSEGMTPDRCRHGCSGRGTLPPLSRRLP